MKHTQEEIIKALQIIQDECVGNKCEECVFLAKGCCGIEELPCKWVLNINDNWRALE